MKASTNRLPLAALLVGMFVLVVLVPGIIHAQSGSGPVHTCVGKNGLLRAVSSPNDCNKSETSLALASFADLQALEDEIAKRPIVEPRTASESTPTLLPNTGAFVELVSFEVEDDQDQLLVTAFAELNAKGCQSLTDVTLRVVLDGEPIADYPAMTSTGIPGTYVVIGLGGLVPLDDHTYGDGGGGLRVVSLEASAVGTQTTDSQGCVVVEDRNINGIVLRFTEIFSGDPCEGVATSTCSPDM